MSGKEEECRSPLAAAVAGESRDVQRAVEVLGQILTGSVTSRATFDGFLHSSFGLHGSDLVCESRWLTAVGHLSAGLAVAALIDKFDPPVGPADDEPPTWGSVVIGDQRLAPPSMLAAHFEAGQLAPVPVVVRICDSSGFTETSRIQVYTAPDDRSHASRVLDAIMDDADGAKSIFRGRALAASSANGLTLEPIELPAVTRASVIVPHEVWAEIDLNVASVTVHRQLMEQLGLGVRRGVLLAGPPGVGKTVISQVISNELVGDFTVINVDARAGQSALSDVYKESRSFGPTLIVIEDIDLIVDSRRNRHGAPSVLSEFLAAMDAHPMAPLLTLASTNDFSTLDAAAIRSARFDSIIEIGYPSREAAARILSRYLGGIPGADEVEVDSVATHFGADMSGADIHEVVRRTVLASSGHVDAADLIATVKSGRFRPQLPMAITSDHASVGERTLVIGPIEQRRFLVENEAARRADHKARLAAVIDACRRRAVVAAADGLIADPRTGRKRLGRTGRGEYVARRYGEDRHPAVRTADQICALGGGGNRTAAAVAVALLQRADHPVRCGEREPIAVHHCKVGQLHRRQCIDVGRRRGLRWRVWRRLSPGNARHAGHRRCSQNAYQKPAQHCHSLCVAEATSSVSTRT